MNQNLNIHPCSTDWLSDDDIAISEYLYGMGFKTLEELMPMRVFDFLNLDCMDAIKAEEFIVCVYKYLHPQNETLDREMYAGYIEQNFDCTGFLRENTPSQLTIGVLVNAEGINREAIYDMFDVIKSAFWHSKEYDWRRYRFANKKEYLAELKRRKQVRA